MGSSLLKIIYESDMLLVVEKPAGFAVFREGEFAKTNEDTIADLIVAQYPELEKLGEEMRYGIVHRLDKDTSGILLAAKTADAFQYLQEQFQDRRVTKKYICLVVGTIKQNKGTIDAPLGRSPGDRRKQKAFGKEEVGTRDIREAVTEYQVLQRYKDYTLIEASPKTGRKHQIRAHFASIHHPLAGDKLYGFKNQPTPEGLNRHFLHASYLKIPMPDSTEKEFESPLPTDLQAILGALEKDKD